jgi:hypothetical protein
VNWGYYANYLLQLLLFAEYPFVLVVLPCWTAVTSE